MAISPCKGGGVEGEGEGEDEGEGAGKCHAAIVSASAASAASTAPDSRKAFSSGVAPPLPPPRSHRVVGKAAAQLRRKAYVSVSLVCQCARAGLALYGSYEEV